jgi:outer membrane protein
MERGAAKLGRLVLLSGLAFALPDRVSAQATDAEVLTLDRALALAIQANPKLDSAQLEVQKAVDGVAAARTHFLPSLNVDALPSYNLSSQAFNFERGVFGTYSGIGPIPAVPTPIESQSGGTTVVSGSIVQPLLQLYRIGLVVDQHQVQQSLAEQALRSQRQELVKQVKQQYYEILKTEASLRAAEESVVFYRELSQLVARYVKEQVALEYEALETRSRLARSEHRVRTERNALRTQQERLNSLLGRDVRTRFSLAPAGIEGGAAPDPSSAEATALAQRPEMQQARLKLQHAENGYRIKRSEYIPDLNLAMRYSRLYNVQFIPNEVWTVGLELKWEFFDWGRKSQQLGQKTADIAQARNEIREVESQVRIEVDARLRDLEEAREYVKVTEITQAAAREKLRVTANLYRERAALLKDVLQAESELADAASEYQKSLLGLYTAQAQLDKALGAG